MRRSGGRPPGSPRSSRRRPRARDPPDARHRRLDAAGRADRLPRAAHVGPALQGGDDARRLHGGRGAGLEPLALDQRLRLVCGRDVHAGRGQARLRLRPHIGPGGARARRHRPGAHHPRDRGVRAGVADPRAHQGRDVRERLARRQGGARHHRGLPRLVLVPRGAARAAAPHPGRGARHRGGAPPPGAAGASARAGRPAGVGAPPALPDRRHPLSRAHRDPAHHRLGHHRLGQDGADLGSRGPDP